MRCRHRLAGGDHLRSQKLLVPAHRAEELRREFVFRFNVIGKDVGVAEARDLKARFKRFRPNLQVAAGVADVLPKEKLAVIAQVAFARQRPGVGIEVGALRGGEPKRQASLGRNPTRRSTAGRSKL